MPADLGRCVGVTSLTSPRTQFRKDEVSHLPCLAVLVFQGVGVTQAGRRGCASGAWCSPRRIARLAPGKVARPEVSAAVLAATHFLLGLAQ